MPLECGRTDSDVSHDYKGSILSYFQKGRPNISQNHSRRGTIELFMLEYMSFDSKFIFRGAQEISSFAAVYPSAAI